MRNEGLRVLAVLDQRLKKERKTRKGRRTRVESVTLSFRARLSCLARSPFPLAVRASCTAVTLVLRDAKARAMDSTCLASDVTSLWTTVAGSRRQLSQCPHGVLSSAQEKSVEEKCLSSFVRITFAFFFGLDKHALCKRRFSALFQIQAKFYHAVGLFMPCVSSVEYAIIETTHLPAPSPYLTSYLVYAERLESDSIIYNLRPSHHVLPGQTLDKTSRAISSKSMRKIFKENMQMRDVRAS